MSGKKRTKDEWFHDLWDGYYAKLCVFVRAFRLPEHMDEEDVVQEIMAKIYTKADTYSEAYSVSTWLYRVARNHCIDMGRRKKITTFHLSGPTESTRITPESHILKEELHGIVGRFIEGLQERDRQITFLRFYEDMSFGEIARVLEIPEGTAKYRASVVRNQLKHHLEKTYA